MLGIMCEDLRFWDDRAAHAWDSTRKGTWITDNVFAMAARASIQVANGYESGQILWDISTFFEKISPPIISSTQEMYCMPANAVALSLWSHAAPRYLKSNNLTLREPLLPSVSVVTGCSSSMSIAKGIVKRALDKSSHPGVWAAPHADDVAQQSDGNEQKTVTSLFESGMQFAKEIIAMGFDISPKSVVLGSNYRIARKLQRMFAGEGIQLRVHADGEHLGHSRSHGCASTQYNVVKKRMAKASKRCIRVGQLAKRDARAVQLYKTGVVPQALFGCGHIGLNKTLQKKLLNMGVTAMGHVGHRPCAVTANMLGHGMLKNVDVLVEVFCCYTKYIRTLSREEKAELQRAWHKVLGKVAGFRDVWVAARCTLSSVQAVAIQAEWTPSHFDAWQDDRSEWHSLGNPEVDARTLTALRASLYRRQWEFASLHYCGDGLQHGDPQLGAVMELKTFFRKKGRPDLAKIAVAVASGGGTTGDRMKRNKACPICGHAEDGPEHRRYQCKKVLGHWKEDELSWSRQSQWLCDVDAVKEFLFIRGSSFQLYDCLRYRGMIPRHMSTEIAEENNQFVHLVGEVTPACEKWHTDGSKPSAYRALAPDYAVRAGAAGVSIQWSGMRVETAAAFIASVPGKQTVPRSELHAGNTVLSVTSGLEPKPDGLEINSDAAYYVGGAAKAGKALRRGEVPQLEMGANGDLWQQHRVLEGSGADVRKVKAHQGIESTIDDDEAFRHWFSNGVADALASVAASRAQLPELTREFLGKLATVAFLSLRRAVLAESVARRCYQDLCYWELAPAVSLTQSMEVSSTLIDKLAETQHQVEKIHGKRPRLRCGRCGLDTPASQIGAWLDIPCGTAVAKVPRVPGGMTVGGEKMQWKRLGQHRAARRRAVWQCAACRLIGTERQLLEAECLDSFADNGGVNLTFEGSAIEFRKEAQARYESNKRSLAANRQTWRNSAQFAVLSLPTQSERAQGSAAGEAPAWAELIHATHSCYHGAGLVWCKGCSAVAIGQHTGNRMRRPCDAVQQSWTLPSGSKSRLSRLCKGRHPDTKARRWPDGRSTQQFICYEFVDRQPGTVLQAELGDEEPRYYTAAELGIEMQARPVVPTDVQDRVNALLEAAAASYTANDSMDLRLLIATSVPSETAEAICIWLGSESFDSWNEQLLEKTIEFQAQLDRLIDTLRRAGLNDMNEHLQEQAAPRAEALGQAAGTM